MVNIQGIYTIRDTPQPYYWDIVFEWENEFSKALNIPLIPVGKQYDRIYTPGLGKKLLNRINFFRLKDKYLFKPNEYYIAFHIGPPGIYSFYSRINVIPIIIDFWKTEDLKRFAEIFSQNIGVFVTSKEVYNYLVEKKIQINLHHLSLSLPDKYFPERNNFKKEIDLIQIGRKNAKLNQYIDNFLTEYPNLHYVHGEKVNGRIQMISNKNGNLGEFFDRDSFMNLLRQSKISLLSAPGLDDDVKRTGGFSPVTPRFLESAACGCQLIGVYPENDDFIHYDIGKICKYVNDYNTFKSIVLGFLDANSIPDYQAFLINHLSSKRAQELKHKLFELL